MVKLLWTVVEEQLKEWEEGYAVGHLRHPSALCAVCDIEPSTL